MTNNNLSVVDARVGTGGNDLFELKISIEECYNLFDLVQQSSSAEGNNDALNSTYPPSSATQYWLSYRCLGKVIQSELFSVSDSPSAATANASPFIPSLQTFHVKREELTSYFNDKKNITLRIHLCTEGNVIATAFVEFGPMMMSNKNVVLAALKVRNEYTFQPRVKDMETSSCARVAVTLSLDKHSVDAFDITDQQKKQELQQQQQHLPPPPPPAEIQKTPKEPSQKQIKKETVNVEEEAAKVRVDAKEEPESKLCSNVDDSNNAQCQRETQLIEREAKLQMREDQVSTKEQELYASLASLDKRRLEWEQSKHHEELAWQERLRNKEAEMMGAIEERIMINEKERLASTEKARSDYEQLERRLTKAILDVEAKDRMLKELHERHQHEYNRKLAELELKEKLVKQEMKHTVEIEVSIFSNRFVCSCSSIEFVLIEHLYFFSQKAKAEAAFEQAVLAKKEAATTAKKVKQVEAEMDELREKHRKTPEAVLMQQLAEIKGQLAESERRVEAMKAEKNQILQDKEKFRVNIKKLVSLFKLIILLNNQCSVSNKP